MPDEKNYKEQIAKLAVLQGIDSEVFELRSQKESFPVRLREMDESLEGKKSGMSNAEEELKRLQVAKNEKETDIAAKEEKIKKHESELYQIKNNKEYQALLDEIASIKADISLLEEDVITLFDEIEAAQARCEDEKKSFEEEAKSSEEEKNEIRAEEKKLDARLNELGAQREQASREVAPEILSVYERILKNKGKVALAAVTGEFCAECNMHLRPQVINEAKLKKSLVFCENCGRMLYDPE